PGYDLVATSPARHRAARVQVKSRWRTGATGFLIRNFECDFVVVVKLNRGSKDGRRAVLSPEFFVFPIEVGQGARRREKWGKSLCRDIGELGSYQGRWDLIREFLSRRAHEAKGRAVGDLA